MIVAVHVGMRWVMIMTFVRSWLRLGAPNAGRTWILRALALVIATYGVHSWMVMGTGSRRMAEMAMNFWNFKEAALRFFLHQGAIMGLLICLSHDSMALIQTRTARNRKSVT
ncbi:MAG: hypothetical protein JWM58_2038 [Rhizobium sp.]|nr:hypothetical protein [Rhizobium sp.]